MLDISGVLAGGAGVLAAAGVESARVDAEILLAHSLGIDRNALKVQALLGAALPDDVSGQFDALIAQRAERVPLQHLTGIAHFRNLTLRVGPGVFIPRPETEVVAGAAIAEVQRLQVIQQGSRPVVIDLCTGSGAIALAVATETSAEVHAIELDAQAHQWAHLNIAALAPPGNPIDLRRGDARIPPPDLTNKVDVVVSNPPYIPPGAVPRDQEVRDHDPAQALYGLGADGLTVPQGIIEAAAKLLKPGGLLIMEHGDEQGPATRNLAAKAGYIEIETKKDLTDRDRYLTARRPPPR